MANFIRIAAALAVVCCCAQEARAQQENDARNSVDQKAKIGDRLTITTPGSDIRGRLVRADPEGLVVRTSAGERAVAYREIDRIRRRSNGIKAGASLGLVAGVAFGLLVVTAVDDEIEKGGVFATTVGMGLGIGIGLDALISSNRTIYRRATGVAQGVSIQPGRGGAALRWTMSW